MSTERRFSDEEVAFILERAASAEPAASEEQKALTESTERGTGQGMSLAQLQEIAAEVGLDAVAVADAARAIDRGDLTPTKRMTYAGLPVGVARTIQFDRVVTEEEWERLVVALRETFQARGKVVREGSLRHWSNGNLQALLEPTEHGHRLRLQTRKGDARAMLGLGVFGVIMAGAISIPLITSSAGTQPLAWLGPAVIAAMGVFAAGRTVFTLPAWAKLRATQMEQFAEKATKLLR